MSESAKAIKSAFRTGKKKNGNGDWSGFVVELTSDTGKVYEGIIFPANDNADLVDFKG